MRQDLQEAEVVQENVDSFPVGEMLGRFLGSAYFIDVEILDPLFYGLPVSRRRLYVKLTLDCNGCEQPSHPTTAPTTTTSS